MTNRLKYALERLLLRGAQYRLLVVAAGIGLISLLGGLAVVLIGTDMPLGTAIWWAFLRLSDPGYLGDDQGLGVRIISTILTVAGYVVFLGALIAILTQWLNATMRALESGLTPIAQRDHVLVLGWTNRTPAVVRELLLSEGRVRRFLRRRGARELRIAILAEDVTSELRRDLQDRLGSLWNDDIVFRSGSPLRLEHLQRVDFTNASAILLPAADFAHGGSAQADTRTIKTLLSITNQLGGRAGRDLPLAVAEIFDARKIAVAKRAYGGNLEILASDVVISRLIAQNVRHPGLSHVYGELLTHGRGSEIYVREAASLAGRTVAAAQGAFAHAILLGIVRPAPHGFAPCLAQPDASIGAEDRVVLLARRYADTEFDTAHTPSAAPAHPPVQEPPQPERRVLVLGWSHKAPALLQEFEDYETERFNVDVVSALPVADRQRALERYGLPIEKLTVRQIEADYTSPSDLARVRPGDYDNIVLLANDWLESGEESDARTILGYLLLRELLEATGAAPQMLVELLDPSNVGLFRRRTGEVLISPVVLSHMLAQVALRRELRAVFDELFGSGGAEFFFRPVSLYGIAPGEHTFEHVARTVAAHGEIALGMRTGDPATEAQGGVKLNPPRDRRFTLDAVAEVIVLGRLEQAAAAQD